MLKHHLILVYRNLRKDKSTFLINLIGLSTGLASVMLIFLWVRDEIRVDKFHENENSLVEVIEIYADPEKPGVNNYTAGMLAEVLADEMPEVEYAVPTRILSDKKTIQVENRYVKAIVQYAGKDFFNVFSYNLVQGDKNRVLADKNSVVISEEMARKLFNTTDNVIGKMIEIPQYKPFRISGVFEGTPVNSTAQFDVILSFEEYKEVNPNALNWNYNIANAYLVLDQGTDVGEFNEKIAHFLEGKRDEAYTGHLTLSTSPYSEAYLYSYAQYENGKPNGGRIEYVWLFSIIGCFVLGIACINFMNLSTAKASGRLKEVGIKKAIGADRKTLVLQYLGESVMMAFLSLCIALLMVQLFLPQFNTITGKLLSFSFDRELLMIVFGVTLLTGIVAGSYPALYLSNFKPVLVLKGKLNGSKGEIWARKGLVIFQFALSLILIVSVVVVYKQIEFVQSQNLGYDKENILYFDMEGKVEENLETFISEMQRIDGIVDASSIGQSVVGGSQNTFVINEWEGKDPDVQIPFETRPVNYGMIELLGLEMSEGRAFSREFGAEDSKIIFNETAIEVMGLENPIGKTISIQGTQLEIIGVTKDFHFASLHEKIDPLFFVLRPTWTHKIMARIEAGREQETIGKLKDFYQIYNPGFSFDFKFLDQEYQAQYIAEQRVSVLSRYFAGIAILISCLGLFGLAAYTAERRVKEIGIRKVLGSSEWKIIQLLSGDFAKMVLVAIFIALPLSYYLTSNWLGGFYYKIDLQWWYFIGAGALTMVIALLTVSFQSIKAALMNPVESLKSE
ncbi:ABC transporter permease [Algoriphagus sp. AGSA1]|uniref:ABC transporter permease n=1 Tax=Algoriphagus sp. AGSA1 TaxID=2907213 RepID=UPI001F1921B5|nr:ABC transporter permease [Algoriphagus sp. AGSA1]MCE7058080.1 ABC transporter permease [Algoriphagus sp. AGSA1]